jgi:hypothetical protein
LVLVPLPLLLLLLLLLLMLLLLLLLLLLMLLLMLRPGVSGWHGWHLRDEKPQHGNVVVHGCAHQLVDQLGQFLGDVLREWVDERSRWRCRRRLLSSFCGLSRRRLRLRRAHLRGRRLLGE